MDGPQLLMKTDFHEARRGYDKAQVDSFLGKLGEKVGDLKDLVEQASRRAEAAEASLQSETAERRAAEAARADLEAALRASEEMRAELAKTLDDTRSQASAEKIDEATGILAMAKRTADATIDEARQKAQRLVEDAEVNAAVTELEAEQRAERTRKDMEEQVESMRRRQLDALEAEVRRLTSLREGLEVDVAELSDFMDRERRKVREGIEALTVLLDNRGPLTIGQQPPRHGPAVIELPDPPSGDQPGLDDPIVQSTDQAVIDLTESSGDEPPAGGAAGQGASTGMAAAGAGTPEEDEEPSPLGDPGEEADAAMREFFEGDLTGAEERRPLRRRR